MFGVVKNLNNFFDLIFVSNQMTILTFLPLIIVPLLIAVAYLTLTERKVLGAMQMRIGPNVVGAFGVLQPLADGLKLFLKEGLLPSSANKILFIFSPILTFSLSLIAWTVIPFDFGVVFADINLGVLCILSLSSLGVYGIVFAGWSSNSRYAFLGSLRSTAQMVSYEVSISLIIVSIVLCVGNLNFSEIVLFQKAIWTFAPLFPISIIFLISALAETNRPPFDLPEAEAELVSGYSVEHAAMAFALFFLGEYANVILMGVIISAFFLGGWLLLILPCPLIWLPAKVSFILYVFVSVRAALPRLRYDQLMSLGWKTFLPLCLLYIILVVVSIKATASFFSNAETLKVLLMEKFSGPEERVIHSSAYEQMSRRYYFAIHSYVLSYEHLYQQSKVLRLWPELHYEAVRCHIANIKFDVKSFLENTEIPEKLSYMASHPDQVTKLCSTYNNLLKTYFSIRTQIDTDSVVDMDAVVRLYEYTHQMRSCWYNRDHPFTYYMHLMREVLEQRAIPPRLKSSRRRHRL